MFILFLLNIFRLVNFLYILSWHRLWYWHFYLILFSFILHTFTIPSVDWILFMHSTIGRIRRSPWSITNTHATDNRMPYSSQSTVLHSIGIRVLIWFVWIICVRAWIWPKVLCFWDIIVVHLSWLCCWRHRDRSWVYVCVWGWRLQILRQDIVCLWRGLFSLETSIAGWRIEKLIFHYHFIFCLLNELVIVIFPYLLYFSFFGTVSTASYFDHFVTRWGLNTLHFSNSYR